MSFEDDDGGENHKQYNLPTVEIKDYNVMINGRNFFDQPIKDDFKTFDDMRKISTGQGDYYTVGCLLDYPYFKKCYKLIAIDLSKWQKKDADPKATQQINFTGNLDRAEGSAMFFIIEEAKEIVLVLMVLFCFNIILIKKKTQCNTLSIKLSNSQLNRSKSAIKNETWVSLNLYQISWVILMMKIIFLISYY